MKEMYLWVYSDSPMWIEDEFLIKNAGIFNVDKTLLLGIEMHSQEALNVMIHTVHISNKNSENYPIKYVETTEIQKALFEIKPDKITGIKFLSRQERDELHE